MEKSTTPPGYEIQEELITRELSTVDPIAYQKLRDESSAILGIEPQELDAKVRGKVEATRPGERLLIAVTPIQLLKHVFPRREMVLAPVFSLASLNMVFSRRGVGKTHVALGIAYASATGGGLWGWAASRPFKTLYIDGEMPGESLQERVAKIVDASELVPPDGYFNVITIDMNDGRMPDLSTLGGQMEIEPFCHEAELIIIDNLSCLCRSGRENEAESWQDIGEWAMRMRSAGKCVIFIHHAGKDGNQRGTSKREDLLDTVIELKRPADYEPEQGGAVYCAVHQSAALNR
jgi:AAA domain